MQNSVAVYAIQVTKLLLTAIFHFHWKTECRQHYTALCYICICINMYLHCAVEVHCSSMKQLEQFLSLMIAHILTTVTYTAQCLWHYCHRSFVLFFFLLLFSCFLPFLRFLVNVNWTMEIRSSDFSCMLFSLNSSKCLCSQSGATPTTLAIKYGILLCRKSICWQLYGESSRLILQHHPSVWFWWRGKFHHHRCRWGRRVIV